MPVTMYHVEIEFQGRLVMEYLVCGVPGGPPIRFLSGSVAGAVARYYGEREGYIIAAEQVAYWQQKSESPPRKLRFCPCDEQHNEKRLLFTGTVEDRNDDSEYPIYLVLTSGLQALSSVQHSPDLALGLPPGTWTPPSLG